MPPELRLCRQIFGLQVDNQLQELVHRRYSLVGIGDQRTVDRVGQARLDAGT